MYSFIPGGNEILIYDTEAFYWILDNYHIFTLTETLASDAPYRFTEDLMKCVCVTYVLNARDVSL